MGITASYLDVRSSKNTHEQIIRLYDYVSGQLNEKTFFFLHEVCQKNHGGIEKIITKCSQLKIQLQAKHIDRIVESLYLQQKLPQDILNSLQYFLMDKHIHAHLQELVSSVNRIDDALESFDPFKSTIHVINKLNIYIHSDTEKQFLSTVITLMIHFYNGGHSICLSHAGKRSIEDTAKWMKSLLSISEKSDLSKLIDLLADRIQLINISLPGKIRSMELIELYSLFEDLAFQTKNFLPHDSNKSLLLDLHAMILLAFASKKSPNAFFDIIYTQQAEPEYEILNLVQSQISKPLVLDSFFNSQKFKPYFRECCIRTHSNQQAFLSIFIHCIQSIIREKYPHTNSKLQSMIGFLKLAYSKRTEMSNETFLIWLNNEIAQKELITLMQPLFFALEHEAKLMNASSGSLIFVANKLVSMGFSPKAISTTQTGSFQPLITSNILQIGQENIQAFNHFFQQLNHQKQHQLIIEIFLVSLITYKSYKLNHIQSKAKFLQKRTADQHYPLPSLHRIQKAKQARSTRLIRKQPSTTQAANFFEPSPNKIQPIKPASKYVARHYKSAPLV